jgi:large subunit ribosomal protein L10
MLTKEQKKQQVSNTTDEIKNSKTLVFADFTGVGVEDLRGLKNQLRQSGAKFVVVKKRLLNIALKQSGIDLDALQFSGPVGTVFTAGVITSVAGDLHKFGQGKSGYKVLGAYDIEKNVFLDEDDFTVIAKLPSREVLIAMIMGGITGPVRAFMSIVKQLSERSSTNNESNTNELIASEKVEEEAVGTEERTEKVPVSETVSEESKQQATQAPPENSKEGSESSAPEAVEGQGKVEDVPQENGENPPAGGEK